MTVPRGADYVVARVGIWGQAVGAVAEDRGGDVVFEYAEEFRRGAVEFADSLVGEAIDDPVLRRWMTTMTVAYVVTSTLAWLEQGDPERDEEMIQRSTDGLAAMFSAWAPDFQGAGATSPPAEPRSPAT